MRVYLSEYSSTETVVLNNVDNTLHCVLTSDGRCWNVYSNKWMDWHGYHQITICHNGIKWNFNLAKELALCFVPNIANKPHVVFKDGNKDNLHTDNLAWSYSQTYVIGQTYHQLIVIDDMERRDDGHIVMLCQCTCGNMSTPILANLVTNTSKSCGCRNIQGIIDRNITHGLTHHPLYRVLAQMIQRCTNPNNDAYQYYGARGISICDSWSSLSNVQNFITWAKANGWYEGCGLSIDRIDNDGPYSPDNCRWVTNEEQMNNTRSNVWLTCSGKSMTLKQWANDLGVDYRVISARLSRGWSVHNALTFN